MPWTTLRNGLSTGWSVDGPQYQPPAYVQGWWATSNRGLRIDATATLDLAALERYPRELDVVVDTAVQLLATQIGQRGLYTDINVELVLDGFARLAAVYGVTTGVELAMEANTGSDIQIDVLVDIVLAAVERYPGAFGVTGTVTTAMAAIERQLSAFTVEASMQAAFTATQSDPRGLTVTLTSDPSFTALVRQLAPFTVTAASGNTFTSAFPAMSATTVTHLSGSGGITIPYWCNHIDVAVVGGGKGGQGGSLLSTGDGGTRAYNNTVRWSRGTHGNEWTNLSYTIGAGGTAGSSGGGSGGNGGATTVGLHIGGTLVDSVAANGGTGAGSGRSGESMIDTTINGMTLVGGVGSNGNGGQPGAGGGGGSSGTGSRPGSPGGAGGAMVRFSQ